MKTQLQLLSLKNPTMIIQKSMIAMMMVFFTSFAFAQSTVVDIVVNSTDHHTLEAAVIAAELADDLSSEGPFTVFAPSDAAFEALPEGTVSSLLEDPTGALSDILLYHVASGRALSTDLSNGQKITTLNGDQLVVKFKDGEVYINDAVVTTADIITDNGVVHVIDSVITPSGMTADAGSANPGSANSSCGN